MKANKEQRVVSKLLKHKFKQNISGKVLLTDITTYLEYSKNKKAHLFIIQDGSTNEILAYHVSERVTLDIATTIILKLKKNKRIQLAEGAFIHSDQGSHYTSPTYQKLVKNCNLDNQCREEENVGVIHHKNLFSAILKMKLL
ncbi:TPA: transposase family protein [Bacillus thuringiensis]|nr:transposase family protein [Bacillus thuringiensis]HDR6518020.1 transposase family protein [Bacillus thuringiensis]